MRTDTNLRKWVTENEELVITDLRTKEALDQLIEKKHLEARRRIAREREKHEQYKSKPLRQIETHYPVKYWVEKLHFGDEAIRIWCKSKELRAQKIKGEWRISEQAMIEFIENEAKRNAS